MYIHQSRVEAQSGDILATAGNVSSRAADRALSDAFALLGDSIEAEWRATDYDDERLPQIARRLLLAGSYDRMFDWTAFIGEVLDSARLARQIDLGAGFGQPPLTLYSTSRFYIALLFWLDSTTSIHEHGFTGAFAVLAGASLHSRFRFESEKVVNSRLAFGRIRRAGSEILGPGSIVEITAGPAGAHALFHLDRPSVTLLVRSHRDERAQPQYEYHHPGLALDPFFKDPDAIRRQQLLMVLQASDENVFDEAARRLMEGADLETSVRTLLYFSSADIPLRSLQILSTVASQRHPSAASHLAGLVVAKQIEKRLFVLRRQVRDSERRLLLALLLNRVGRKESLDLLASIGVAHPAAELSASLSSLLDEVDGPSSNDLRREAVERLIRSGSIKVASEEILANHRLEGGDAGLVDSLLTTIMRSPVLQDFFATREMEKDNA